MVKAKTVYVYDPFVWPAESYVEQLESCEICRHGLLGNTICDACLDALSGLLNALRQTGGWINEEATR